MLVKYKISNTKLDFVNKPMTAKTVYNTYKPTAFINACLYDMATSTNITNVKDETVPDGYLFTSEGIGIVNGKPKWTTIDDTTVKIVKCLSNGAIKYLLQYKAKHIVLA